MSAERAQKLVAKMKTPPWTRRGELAQYLPACLDAERRKIPRVEVWKKLRAAKLDVGTFENFNSAISHAKKRRASLQNTQPKQK